MFHYPTLWREGKPFCLLALLSSSILLHKLLNSAKNTPLGIPECSQRGWNSRQQIENIAERLTVSRWGAPVKRKGVGGQWGGVRGTNTLNVKVWVPLCTPWQKWCPAVFVLMQINNTVCRYLSLPLLSLLLTVLCRLSVFQCEKSLAVGSPVGDRRVLVMLVCHCVTSPLCLR